MDNYTIRPFTIEGLRFSDRQPNGVFLRFDHHWPMKPRQHRLDQDVIFKHERFEWLGTKNLKFWPQFKETIELFYPDHWHLIVKIENDLINEQKEFEEFISVTMLRDVPGYRWAWPEFPQNWRNA